MLFHEFQARDMKTEILDGDVVRKNLSKGLGFSKEDRDTNIMRIGFVANLLTRNGVATICCPISPYKETRDANRALIGEFVEVYVHATVEEIAANRDPKGLYKKALAGEIKGFTGVSPDAPYEVPENPELVGGHADRDPRGIAAARAPAPREARVSGVRRGHGRRATDAVHLGSNRPACARRPVTVVKEGRDGHEGAENPVALYIAAYDDPNAAQSDYDALKELVKAGAIFVDVAVLVSRDDEGKLYVKENAHEVAGGTMVGAAAGLLIGLIFPPAFLASGVVGGAVGAGIGKLREDGSHVRHQEGSRGHAAVGYIRHHRPLRHHVEAEGRRDVDEGHEDRPGRGQPRERARS